MTLKKNTSLPDTDHILRHVSWSKLRKDENDNVIGINGDAFKLREATKSGKPETSLSANHIECYPGTTHNDKVISAIQDARNVIMVKPKAGFAVCNVGCMKFFCREKKVKIHIVSDPTEHNKTHVAVKSIPADDDDLLDLLASEDCSRLVLNNSVP